MLPYQDPKHEGNSAKYHTGKPCVVKGCEKPAGTWWGPSWCFEHNVERLDRISVSLDDFARKAEFAAAVDKATETMRALIEEKCREVIALVRAAGGEVTVTRDQLESDCKYESCNYHKDGSRTYRAL